MSPAPLTVILGAGISGLSCAYALKKAGENVLVLEADQRAGGVIQSVRDAGFLCELGPQSFSGTWQIFALCDDLGISGELVEAPRRAPRFIWLNGEFLPVPMSPGAFLSSKLLSWKTKRSILKEVFRTSPPPPEDESVAAFVRRRFTAELLDRLVGPLVAGIYAGDPEELSLRAAFPKLYEAEKLSGSIIRGGIRLAKHKPAAKSTGRRPGLYSFREGNQTLINRLAASLGSALRLGVASSVQREASNFVLTLDSGSTSDTIRAEKLVLATPVPVTDKLLAELAPDPSRPACGIEYAQVAVVSHGYRSDQIGASLNGFGFLIPRSENIRTLGCVWNSSLFLDRAPADHVLFTSFIGGATLPKLLSKEESAYAVRTDLEKILQISGSPVLERVTSYSSAIPQYNLGHSQRLQAIREAVARMPGLWIVGNYWNGPAIGACIEHSFTVAEQVRIG